MDTLQIQTAFRLSFVQTCSVEKCVLRNFAKFTGKHLCQSLFFNKVAGRPAGVKNAQSCKIKKLIK